MKLDMEVFSTFFKKNNLFDDHMGLKYTIIKPGEITYELTVAKKHLSSADACHGGVLAGMMDGVLGLTALTWCVQSGNLCATVEFKINYINPAKIGDTLIGKGNIDYTGSRLIVTNGSINQKKTGQLVAKGMGTFTQYPLKKRESILKELDKKAL